MGRGARAKEEGEEPITAHVWERLIQKTDPDRVVWLSGHDAARSRKALPEPNPPWVRGGSVGGRIGCQRVETDCCWQVWEESPGPPQGPQL